MEIHYAIDLIIDLAALLLECKVNGSIALCELDMQESDTPDTICITATPKEHALIQKSLAYFVVAPSAYDLSEMLPEEDMMELVSVCEELRKELYGGCV